jgi:nitroreductase
MKLQEAIQARHSVRAYKDQPVTDEDARLLQEQIDAVNREGQLHIQLIRNEPRAFQGTLAKYGKFRGVTDYLVMAGVKADDLDEHIGYYGEQLVLFAQTIGLNTCWVGLSYSKISGTYALNDGEVILAYIAIGYGETQGVSHKIKRIDQVSNVTDLTPGWFRRGVEAALLAPTAVNQQKFSFEYLPAADGLPARVVAKRHFSLIGYTHIDLGIAKCHFEIAAGKNNFQWA